MPGPFSDPAVLSHALQSQSCLQSRDGRGKRKPAAQRGKDVMAVSKKVEAQEEKEDEWFSAVYGQPRNLISRQFTSRKPFTVAPAPAGNTPGPASVPVRTRHLRPLPPSSTPRVVGSLSSRTSTTGMSFSASGLSASGRGVPLIPWWLPVPSFHHGPCRLPSRRKAPRCRGAYD
jgi:hypothetical protein